MANYYRQLITKLDDLVKSRFIEMFGDPIQNPKEWNKEKLRDLLIIERGGSPRPIDDYITEDPNGLNWIKIGDAQEGSYYIDSVKEKIKPEGLKKTREVVPGDLILSNSMSFGKPYILKISGCIHDGWLVLRDSENRFNKLFLCMALGSPSITHAFKGSARGAVVNNLNKDLVGALDFIVPPIELQNKFVEFVEQVDKSKVIAQKAAEKYDQLVKSRFIEMFGHINLNEKDLPKKALNEVCLLVTDGSHYSPADEPNGKYPMLSVKDLSNGKFDYSDCKHINQSEYDKLVKDGCKPIKNDVLIAKDGSVFQKSMIVTDEIDQVILSSIAIIRPKIDVINPVYLERYLMSDYVKEDVINNYTTGTAIRRIILKNLAKLKLIVPKIESQNEFASFVHQVNKSKFKVAGEEN